jgi:hypothetical protein
MFLEVWRYLALKSRTVLKLSHGINVGSGMDRSSAGERGLAERVVSR